MHVRFSIFATSSTHVRSSISATRSTDSCKILYIKQDNHKGPKQSDDRESQDDQLVIDDSRGVANLDESGSFWLWVVSAWVVSALFLGESIRPILVGRFGRELFWPWVVLASLNIGAKSTYFCS